MAEAQGFRDSFVEASPKKQADNNKRFSSDFSIEGSPAHTEQVQSPNHTPALINGATDTQVTRSSSLDDFCLEPDRSDTPPLDGSHDSDDNDEDGEDSKSLPDVLQGPAVSTKSKEWESFDDSTIDEHKSRLDDLEASLGPRCGVDITTNQPEWTALHDTLSKPSSTHTRRADDESLPFRRTKSLRADTHLAVRVVDSLRQQRRLSNTSLDRDLQRTQVNEDDLTRKFKIGRQWDIYLKMNRRIPGTKTKWLQVRASIKDGVFMMKKNAIPSGRKRTAISAGVEEMILQHNHQVTPPVPRSYDRRTKLHQMKIQQTRIEEKRTFKRFLLMEHVTTSHTLLKLGSHDLTVIESVSEAINEAVRQLPMLRARGVAYRMNEVFIDVKESSDILTNCDGAVLDRKSLNRIYVQAFLSGAPECKLALNDIEGILLQGKSVLTQSMNRQVRLIDVVLHPCVNEDMYRATRELKFQPVDGSRFELLRCSIDPYVSPPIIVSCLMEYNQAQHNVRITTNFVVRKKHNLQQRPITNLVIKFPVPTSWSSLFMTETKLGQQRSIGSTSTLRGSFRRKIKTRECQIETHLGSAKYEAEHLAIMWRLGTYTNSSAPHTFSCNIQLKSGMQKPDMQNEQAEVTYIVPGSSTGLAVKGFHFEGNHKPETWVKYEIQYRYGVQMFPDLSID